MADTRFGGDVWVHLSPQARVALEALLSDPASYVDVPPPQEVVLENPLVANRSFPTHRWAIGQIQRHMKVSSDSYFLLATDGRIIDFNDVGAAYVRKVWNEQPTLGESIEAYISAADLSAFRSNLLRAFAGESIAIEKLIKYPNVGRISYLVQYLPVRADEEDRICAVAFIGRDVTQTHGRAFRGRLYEAGLEQTLDGTVILDAQEHGAPVLYVNPAFERITGCGRGEVIGRPLHLLFGDHDDQEAMVELRQAIADERPCRVELRTSRKDGSLLWTQLTITPIRDASNVATHFVATFLDITERRRMELELQLSDEVLRQLPLGILLVDREGRCGRAAGMFAQLFGLEPGQLEGQHLEQRFGREHRPRLQAWLAEAIERGETVGGDVDGVRADGTVVPIEVSVQRFQAPNLHESTRALVLLQDVSRRYELEAQVRQAQKLEALGLLAGGVAHDFNNLLMAILSSVMLLRLDDESNPTVASELEAIEGTVHRASQLTKALLSFARRDQGAPRPIEVAGFVEQLRSLLLRLLGDDIELAVSLPVESIFVRIDPGLLEQVVINLAINARDAMTQGGRLELRARARRLEHGESPPLPAGRYVGLSVEDTGAGIGTALQERIFEPFFTTKEKGTGLGLSTCFGIAQQAGGRIELECSSSAGSTFTLWLPACDAPPPLDLASAAPERDKAPGGTETILLVEDEEVIRTNFARFLRKLGYQVLEAKDGEVAVQRVEREGHRIDLLVTDVVMPRLGGLSVAAHLRRRHPKVAILFMSGHAGDADRDLSPLGRLLRKPFDGTTLAEAIRMCLDRETKS